MNDTYRNEIRFDMQKIIDEQVRKIQQRVDQATLDNAADTLAEFGYVKVNGNSRWFELFGTPERAARMLQRMCDIRRFGCSYCPIYKSDIEDCDDYDALLEWMKQEVDA